MQVGDSDYLNVKAFRKDRGLNKGPYHGSKKIVSRARRFLLGEVTSGHEAERNYYVKLIDSLFLDNISFEKDRLSCD